VVGSGYQVFVCAFILQYIVEFGGFSGTGGKEECFSDLHYLDTSCSKSIGW